MRAPEPVRDYLGRHLDLMRYRALADLDDTELDRLVIAADRNARDLLGTLGFFSPEITIERDKAVAGAGTTRIVRIAVTPGPATLVQAVSHPAHSKAVQIVSACRMDAYMDFVP